MDMCELVMPRENSDFIADYLRDCLLHWQGMFTSCRAIGLSRWGFRPKHHYLEHLGEQVRRTQINPRILSCIQDESFLGQIKHVATKTHSASALLRIFQRLLLNLGQRFEDTRKEFRGPTPTKVGGDVPSLF